MQIPIYRQNQLPTAGTGQVKSLAGERETPSKIPKTETARWSQIKNTADKAFDISLKIEQSEAQTELQDKLLVLKDEYARIDTDIKQNPIYKDMSVKKLEEVHGQMSTELQSKVLDNTEHFLAKKSLIKESKNMGIASRLKAKNFAYANVIDKNRATTLKALDVYSNSFGKDGNIDDLALGEAAINGAVASGAFSKQEGVKMLQGFNNKAIATYYDSLIKTSPLMLHEQVIKQGKEPAAWGALEESIKTQLKQSIKAEYNKQINKTKIAVVGEWQNQSIDEPIDTWNSFKKVPRKHFSELNNQEYSSLKKQLKNAYSAQINATTGNTIDPVLKGRLDRGLDDAVTQTENLGIQPGGIKDAINAVYGNNAKTRAKGQAVYEEYQAKAQQAFGKYAVKQDIRNGNVTANEAYLKDIKPVEGMSDFNNRQIVYDSAVKEFNQKIEKMSTDPKALFDEYFPQKRPAALDPAMRIRENQRYMVNLTDWYKRQGLPENMWRVMTKDEAEIYADSIPNKPVNEIINDVMNIEAEYGNMSKYAFRDLSREGFPTELRLISDLNPNQLDTVGVDLANAYKLKEVDFAKAMGVEAADARAAINEHINSNSEINDYVDSVYTTGTTANNIKVVSNLKNATRKLSYVYKMRGTGDKAAVKKAATAIIGGRFNYAESNNMTVRVPTKFDSKVVGNKMETYVDKLKVSDLSPKYIKPNWLGADKKRNEKQMIKNLKKKSYWKNDGSDSSRLVLVGGDGVPVFDKDEKPIVLDMNKL